MNVYFTHMAIIYIYIIVPIKRKIDFILKDFKESGRNKMDWGENSSVHFCMKTSRAGKRKGASLFTLS